MPPLKSASDHIAARKEELIQLLRHGCKPDREHQTVRAALRLLDDCIDWNTREMMRIANLEKLHLEANVKNEERQAKLALQLELIEGRAQKQQIILQLFQHALNVHLTLRKNLSSVDTFVADLVHQEHLNGIRGMWELVIAQQATDDDKNLVREALVECAQDLVDRCRDGVLSAAFPLNLLMQLGDLTGVTYDDVGTTQVEINEFLDKMS